MRRRNTGFLADDGGVSAQPLPAAEFGGGGGSGGGGGRRRFGRGGRRAGRQLRSWHQRQRDADVQQPVRRGGSRCGGRQSVPGGGAALQRPQRRRRCRRRSPICRRYVVVAFIFHWVSLSFTRVSLTMYLIRLGPSVPVDLFHHSILTFFFQKFHNIKRFRACKLELSSFPSGSVSFQRFNLEDTRSRS